MKWQTCCVRWKGGDTGKESDTGKVRQMLSILGFLTRFPVGRNARINDIARVSYLFPAAGALIGFSVAVFASVISYFSSESSLNAVITLIFLYFITGLIHLDGLADFADGVFASGSVEDKIKAMKDEKVGISGIFAVLSVVLLNIFALNSVFARSPSSQTAIVQFAQFFIVSEISAKLCMNSCMLFGKNAKLRAGMGAYFIENFSYKKFFASTALSLFISSVVSLPFFPLYGFYRSLLVFTGFVIAFIVSGVSVRNLGAVSGDVIGASNEIARCACFVLFALLK
ncbi:MAG: adenosylcobinamide-GDP ribazoletransferase [Canidatus Methanoxibalbensis ujae]|nr:adenosylcobinamide-GDP ribazoletransferase [Candidatus Methanoxibalbensis ujae]